MKENHRSKLSKWLELLQQESWQLELIISGFSIFLVCSLYDPLVHWGRHLFVAGQGFESDVWIGIPVVVILVAWFFLLINLIFHVVLRGLWISTIGLRYVSGEIEWDELNLSPKFENYLKKNVGSYDDYIEKLEKLCSVVFAFTFMIIFMFLSFTLFILFSIALDLLFTSILETILKKETADIILTGIGITLFFFGLLYFIDFLTLGWIKRQKWLSRFYLPFYRFFGWVTLANLYRPMYYNLIDNKYGRRLAKLLVPYVLVIGILSSFQIKYHPYFPSSSGDGNYWNRWDYLENYEGENRTINNAVIHSKYVENGFIELYLHYNHRKYGKVVKEFCPNFKPIHENVFSSSMRFNIDGKKPKIRENVSDTSLMCIQQLYEIKVNDSIFQHNRFRFYTMKENFDEKGLKTVFDVGYLPRGEHLLKLSNQKLENDSLIWETLNEIPFWIE